MHRCHSCFSTIVFGGVHRADGLRFCNETCAKSFQAAYFSIPEAEVTRVAEAVHHGPCPMCNGAGPVQDHCARWIFSFLFFTTIGGEPELCCRRCGNKSRVICIISSTFLGWWSLPMGVISTPFVIGSNLVGLFRKRNGITSDMLVIVRKQLAESRPQAVERSTPEPSDDRSAPTTIVDKTTSHLNPELPSVVHQIDWITLELEVTRPQLESERIVPVTYDGQSYPFPLNSKLRHGQILRVETGNGGPPVRVKLCVL